jgi:hypothetical protein
MHLFYNTVYSVQVHKKVLLYVYIAWRHYTVLTSIQAGEKYFSLNNALV